MEPSRHRVDVTKATTQAAEAAQAVEYARGEQIQISNKESEARIAQSITKAIEAAFKIGEGEQRFIDTARIPLICKDIAQVKTDISAISDSIKWGTRVVLGAVILGVMALLFVK